MAFCALSESNLARNSLIEMLESIKNFPRTHPVPIALCIILLVLKITCYTPQPIYWDSATYIHIAKYLFSGGTSGFTEPFRPALWPIMLGVGWKLSIDPILWGKVLQSFFSLGNVILVYLLGVRIYDKRTGALAALFFTLSPSLFFWGNANLTGIPSLFFGLLAIYLYTNDKPFLSGIAASLAFLTRFTHLITIGILAIFATIKYLKGSFPNITKFAAGCALPIVFFLMLNLALYDHMLTPFTDAASIYTKATQSWINGIIFCMKMIIKSEGWILAFIPVSLMASFGLKVSEHKLIILTVGLLQFAWVGKLPTDITRLFISCLPYLYLLSADGIIKIFDILKKNIAFTSYIFITLIGIYAGYEFHRLTTITFPKQQLTVEQQYVQAHNNEMSGVIWISDPRAILYSNLKADERLYYPGFSESRAEDLRARLNEPDYIFIDSKDLRCRPIDNMPCQKAKVDLFADIRANLKEEFYQEMPQEHRALGIFKRK